jgi:hypothetical protein
MHRAQSRYKDHPRITWFGTDGTVAYVDYVSATGLYFIGGDGHGNFRVIPPNASTDTDEDLVTGFASIDDGIQYALEQVG